VCEQQERAFNAAGLSFPSLHGRRLQPIDCQNLFCEISKYARIAHPTIAGLSGRTRIKQIYRRDPAPIAEPFYPPRWNLEIQLECECAAAGGETPTDFATHGMGVAQSGGEYGNAHQFPKLECLTVDQEVGGSTPPSCTTQRYEII